MEDCHPVLTLYVHIWCGMVVVIWVQSLLLFVPWCLISEALFYPAHCDMSRLYLSVLTYCTYSITWCGITGGAQTVQWETAQNYYLPTTSCSSFPPLHALPMQSITEMELWLIMLQADGTKALSSIMTNVLLSNPHLILSGLFATLLHYNTCNPSSLRLIDYKRQIHFNKDHNQ